MVLFERCLLLVMGCLLHVVCVFVVCEFVVCCMLLFVGRCVLFVVCRSLFAVVR